LVAYAGFGAALLVLVIDPSLSGGSFYHPRFVSLVHLLTLPWLTGSILGSLYIVGPLALRVPMPVDKLDWVAFGAFVFGASGMIAHFWINTYDGMAWSAAFVIGAITWVGAGLLSGLRGSKIPAGVRLHLRLAFVNILAAAAFGIVLGLDHSRGFLTVSPLATMFAHAHLAAVGFVTMLVIGLSYRLLPMMLPSEMPSGRSIALSAILIECGLVALAVQLMMDSEAIWLGALLIAAGLLCFLAHVRWMLMHRLPRPPALPARDWSTWQVRVALAWLLAATVIGVLLSMQASGEQRLPLMWIYGIAGLVGFLAQMVAGVQGRLVPLYAWYRANAAAGSAPPRAANALPSSGFARPIFLCWAAAVPTLAWGLSQAQQAAIRWGALLLLAGLGLGGAYLVFMLRRALPHPPRTIPQTLGAAGHNRA
jgi:hypothetical protein